MSNYDKPIWDLHFYASSRTPKAPAFMNAPEAGAFRLLNLYIGEKNTGPMRAREHRHMVYHLVIYEEGDNLVLVNNENIKTHRGLCLFTHPSDSHSFAPHIEGVTRYHAITFGFARMRNAPKQHTLLSHYSGIPIEPNAGIFHLPEEAMQKLPAILSDLHAATPPHTAIDAAHLHRALLDLFLLVAEFGPARPPAPSRRQRPPAVKAREYLNIHYAKGVTLEDVAKHVGTSPAHLGRAFKMRYGVSPGRYRDNLRVEAARTLVVNSDLLVKQIAYELGYPDAATFSKAFCRNTGRSPIEYRNMISSPSAGSADN